VAYEPEVAPAAVLIATGSEVHIAMDAALVLNDKGVPTRVVSMPSWDLFEQQPSEYRDSVLPPSLVRRVSVEAGTTIGWHRYVGDKGTAIGIDHFGSSAPGEELFQRYGFTAERVASAVTALMEGDVE